MRTERWTSWLGGLAVAVGVGTAALVAGQAVAHAEADSAPSTVQHSTTQPSTAQHSTAQRSTAQRSAVGHSGRPAAVQSRRAAPPAAGAVVERSTVARPARVTTAVAVVSSAVTAPAPTDATPTAYGDIGKWMVRSDGQVANWGGKTYRGKQLYEPVNVVIIDPTSTTAAESTRKLNSTLARAGFPAMALHSVGFQGYVGGQSYGQQPTGFLQAYSDDFFLLPNNHGRVFGPAPAPGGAGFVYTASFSRERIGLYCLLPGHLYVSFGRARSALRDGLVRAGATDLGLVALGNSLETPTETTGDHDGYAAVIMLA